MKFIILILTFSIYGQFLHGQSSNKTMPLYEGGSEQLMRFIQNNLVYPIDAKENCITGTVVLRFLVTISGKIDSIQIVNSIDKLLDNESIRVIKLTSGHWKPGNTNDTLVSVWMTMPFKFLLKNAGCKDSNFYYNAGVKLFSEQNYEKAMAEFSSAIKLNPYDLDALYNISICKIKLNDIDGACVYLKRIKDMGKADADQLLSKYCK